MIRSLDWEDGRILEAVCSTVSGPVLSVLDAGDVALTLSCMPNIQLRLASDKQSDQALFGLKYTAMRQLHPDNVYNLLGVHPAGRRVYVYHQLRSHLSESIRGWWDQREDMLREGLIHAGLIEQRHKRLRQWARRLHLNLENCSSGRRTSLLQRAFPSLPIAMLADREVTGAYVHMFINDVWSPEALENGPASLSKTMMAQVRRGSSKWVMETQSMESALSAQSMHSLGGCYLGPLSQRRTVKRLFELLKDRLSLNGIVLCWSESCPSANVFEWERVTLPTQSVHSGDLWKGTL